MQQWQGKWEKRWHPLREEWVVYAAHRNQRPWTTGKSLMPDIDAQKHDPECYLCPNNQRVHGSRNPDYQQVYIFENDHPVVGTDAPEVDPGDGSLYRSASARGIAKVVCYDPRHHVTPADLDVIQLEQVFKALRTEMQSFLENPAIKNVLIFENKGKITGVSNPHPHGQIYAVDFIFKDVQQHLDVAAKFREKYRKNIFEEILLREQKDRLRIVAENETAIAFIPFFARYAYEVMLFPKKRHATLATFSDRETSDMAALYQQIVRRFDLNYQMRFPYVMSMVQAPVDQSVYPEHHMYLWFQPPLRQPGLQKFLAGPEIGIGNFMADTLPEEKAAELRAVDVSQYQETT
jgi:UDPglucose--hexose-1-phosphate uridylyltransferase